MQSLHRMIPILSTGLLTAVLLQCSAEPENRLKRPDWDSVIRRDHPRLFFNADTWPAIKNRALGEERELLGKIESRLIKLTGKDLKNEDYGPRAAEAAFVWLVTGKDDYAELGSDLLSRSIDYYQQRYAEGKNVNWYSFSRINAWAAFDWLFNYLSPDDRKRLGVAFLEAVKNVQPTFSRMPFDRENWSEPTTGFYGTSSLLWYAGLATYDEGIDDSLAEGFLNEGFDLYLRLLEHRSKAAGDDGGSASMALNYALAAYPWAEFNFFHTYRSATGDDMARNWPYVAYLPGYIFWNWLSGGREFGAGDAYHTTNRISLRTLNLHLSQIIHFYK